MMVFDPSGKKARAATLMQNPGQNNKSDKAIDRTAPVLNTALIADDEEESEEVEDSQAGTSGLNADVATASAEGTQHAQMYIDQKIESSLTKVQSFFEKKFEDLARVRELEKQLEENQRQLSELKAKGNPEGLIREEDIQSEITIYCNVVQKQQGSSSSEDFDTSDELMLDGINIAEKDLAAQ